MSTHKNGQPWLDTDGNVIHAHGGHMLLHEGYYYWYGENRDGDCYVSCYRTKDFKSFEFRGNVLTVDTPTAATRVKAELALSHEVGGVRKKVNIERPKVLCCEHTGKFVMWMHYENGQNYLDARCAVATSDYPDRDFTYHGSFNPFGDMARDCTLFLDDDGKAYFIAASRDNAELHIWRLSRDFLNVDRLVRSLWPGEFREAPALFKKDGKYYMLSSYCTGWAPNQGKWSCADSIDGDWELLEDFGDATTYGSQPAFVLPYNGEFIYVGDRWGMKAGVAYNREMYNQSTYVVLKIELDPTPRIDWCEDAYLM